MIRKAMDDLIKWKNKKNRKPLLLYEARQVGKTYLVKMFGEKYFKDIVYVNFETNNIIGKMFDEKYFKDIVYVNFETNNIIGKMFDENITSEYIIRNLEIVFGEKIDKENTLIFFDEIQKIQEL